MGTGMVRGLGVDRYRSRSHEIRVRDFNTIINLSPAY